MYEARKVGFSVSSSAGGVRQEQITENPVFQALRYVGRASPRFELE
jgi:hypothetical protein